MTFVCAHMAHAAMHDRTVGFVCYPGSDDDGLTDAWCEDCEVFLQAHGGDWIEGEVEVPDGLEILCSECYLGAKRMAKSEGRLHVL